MQGYVQHVFEDVEYLFDKGVVIPDKDVTIPHISTDGDALIFRRGGLLVWYHADFSRGYPHCPLIIRQEFSLLVLFQAIFEFLYLCQPASPQLVQRPCPRGEHRDFDLPLDEFHRLNDILCGNGGGFEELTRHAA